MPDLITHVAINHLVRRTFDLKNIKNSTIHLRTLFYLGTILPDILTRPWYIIFAVSFDWTFPFHTPIGMILTCSVITLFFKPILRKTAFINLITGAFLHFVIDVFQKHISYGEFWFFPFSWNSFYFGLLWADEIMNFIPLWIGLIVVIEVGIWLWRKKKLSA